MKIRLWLALITALATPALAEPVRVTSGEHAGFTRLVLDYGRPIDWEVGRSADGYLLRLAGSAQTYDLTGVFRLIGTSRLAAIWVAPDSGHLHIGLACACHAIPFEFRPGIIVVDLKDGPPPKGSAFETALDGSAAPPIAAPQRLRPQPRPETLSPQVAAITTYDWTANLQATLRDGPPTADLDPAVLTPDPGLQPLRDQILQQMSRAVAQGVVDMAMPDQPPSTSSQADFPRSQIRIGPAPTSVNNTGRSVRGDLGARGQDCTAPERLNLANWGDESLPVLDQIAAHRRDLSGEFDRADPLAVARAVQFQLYLGYGAEARQMISAFDISQGDAQIWRALSYVLDGQADPDGTFRGQAACAGPVALWATLDDPQLTTGDKIDTGAIRLAFTDLPAHLRRLIGPVLSERLLALGAAEAARAITATLGRAPESGGPALALMEAGLDLHNGHPAEAEARAQEVLSDPGPNQPEALIALTEARASRRLPMSPDVALALHAHLNDHAGTRIEPRLQDALILAQAASGNFSAAFEGLAAHPSRREDVWAMAATLAPDDVFLTFAVVAPGGGVPDIADETATAIARRLSALGLGPAAAAWLTTVQKPDPLLVAEVALRRADGRAALAQLAGLQGERAEALTLQALALLSEDRARADLLTRAEDLSAASAAFARAGDWQELAAIGQTPWQPVAARLASTPMPPASDEDAPQGPLARGHALATAGQDTRLAIQALLGAIPSPAGAKGPSVPRP